MKHNLFIYVKKIKLLVVSFFVVVALSSVGFVVARERFSSTQVAPQPPVRTSSQPAPTVSTTSLQPSAPPLEQSTAPVLTGTWNEVQWLNAQPLPWSNEVQAWVNANWTRFNQEMQRHIRSNLEVRMQQLQAGAQQTGQSTTQQQLVNQFAATPQSVVTSVDPFASASAEPKVKEKSWSLFDYESKLTQYLPSLNLTAAQGAVAGSTGTALTAALATVISAPALAYLGLGAIALGGTAFAFDRIAFLFDNKHLTRDAAIKEVKQLLQEILLNSGAYPTYASQIEGLKSENEFVNVSKLDPRIVNAARKELIEEIEKNKEVAFANNPLAKVREEKIDAKRYELRKTYANEAAENKAESYLTSLEKTANMIDSQAYVSEYTRAKMHVLVRKGKLAAEKVEKEKKEKTTLLPTPSADQQVPAQQPSEKSALWWLRQGG